MRLRAENQTLATGRSMHSDINVTPLVDVCLVLLIIFMVVTPLIKESNGVALPETERPAALPDHERRFTVAIKADGTLLVDQVAIGRSDLAARLRAIKSAMPGREVVVKGDRRLRYAEVRDVIRAISEAGYTQAALATHKKESSTRLP